MANGLHLIKLEYTTWVQPECLIGCDCAARQRKKQSRSTKQVPTNLPEFSRAKQIIRSLPSLFIWYSFSVAFQRSSRGTYHVKQWVWWWHWSLQHCWRRRTRIWLHLGACARAEFWAPNQSRRRTLSPAGARDKIMLKEFFWFTMNEGPSTGKIKMSTKKQIERFVYWHWWWRTKRAA